MIEVHASTNRIGGALNQLGIKNSTAPRVNNAIFVSRLTGVDLEIGQPPKGGIDDLAVWNDVFLDVFESPYPCHTRVGAPLVMGLIDLEITAFIGEPT
jgi:hypothetical protein